MRYANPYGRPGMFPNFSKNLHYKIRGTVHRNCLLSVFRSGVDQTMHGYNTYYFIKRTNSSYCCKAINNA